MVHISMKSSAVLQFCLLVSSALAAGIPPGVLEEAADANATTLIPRDAGLGVNHIAYHYVDMSKVPMTRDCFWRGAMCLGVPNLKICVPPLDEAGGMQSAQVIPVEKDPSGKMTEVLIGTGKGKVGTFPKSCAKTQDVNQCFESFRKPMLAWVPDKMEADKKTILAAMEKACNDMPQKPAEISAKWADLSIWGDMGRALKKVYDKYILQLKPPKVPTPYIKQQYAKVNAVMIDGRIYARKNADAEEKQGKFLLADNKEMFSAMVQSVAFDLKEFVEKYGLKDITGTPKAKGFPKPPAPKKNGDGGT